MSTGDFDLLSPHAVLEAVESAFGLSLDSNVQPFSSYVNRVYGLGNDEARYVAKFYRPGRWTRQALEDEHLFLADCVEAELPVVAGLPGTDGNRLQTLVLEDQAFHFALFPQRAGRLFDAENDQDWIRLGSLTGRLHLVGLTRGAPHRVRCHPLDHSATQLQELYDQEVLHPDLENEFFDLCEEVLERLGPAFDLHRLHRIHGDLHRGNILDRGPEGLLLIDFDDMMNGPAVQDLWLLLPGRLEDCVREQTLLLEGYSEYLPLPAHQWELVEGLRFMRMIHHLAWCARQRLDHRFAHAFPDWGSKAFWIREVEDFRTQARFVVT